MDTTTSITDSQYERAQNGDAPDTSRHFLPFLSHHFLLSIINVAIASRKGGNSKSIAITISIAFGP